MQQIQRQFTLMVLLIGGAFGIRPAAAQYTANFQTNTISGVTSNWLGNYIVGSNTFCNALIIRNGGVLADADGYLGYQPASSSNSVLVTGAGSVWSNTSLSLGSAGSGNSLVISNAGRVANSLWTYVAYGASSSSNRILVTGTNSVLNCANNLSLGLAGPGNSMVISNGGRVLNTSSELGNEISSTGNSVLVTGPGSAWTNNGTLTIGRVGGGNSMAITKGGRVLSTYTILGSFDSASSNSVLVADTNSFWDNSAEASDINIGLNTSGNSLVVTNGGKVQAYYAYFGRRSCGNNTALITGPGSVFSVQCYIYTGNEGHDNSFTVANGASVNDKFCYISREPAGSNNAVLVTGTNSTWQNSFSAIVGFAGVAGSLTISNGASMLTTEHNVLGQDPTSRDNRVLVTGGGSLWDCILNVYVGFHGQANSLVISNGGKVSDDFGSLGLFPDSVSNSVRVVGSGSIWTNRNHVYVGHSSVGNSLVISNGARVYDNRGYVGWDADGNDNNALVSGTGSVWSNSYATLVGNSGSGNTLVIRDGGLVADFWGIIGEEDPSVDNTVYVEPGGTWRTQRLRVGDYGSHNALFVNGGSVVAGSTMDVGYDPIYYNNLVQLNSGQIVVTNAAHNAVLEVYGGSFVLAGGILNVDKLIVTNNGAQFMAIGGTLMYRSLQLNPAFDVDADGIPNGWEQARGLNPLDPFDAEADNDGDKMSNLAEFMAGTNPTNAASNLAVTSLVCTNGNVRVNWQAMGGKSYVVQTNSGFGTAFTDASPVIAVPGSGQTATNYLHSGAAVSGVLRLYRVRLAP